LGIGRGGKPRSVRNARRRFNEADAIYLPMARAIGGEIAPGAISVLEGPLTPDAEAHQRELAARLMPNQRRRIAVDRMSWALPRWVDVPGAEPDDHWVELPAPGDATLRAVLDWTARWSVLPFPADRPPWRSVRFDGVTVDGTPGRTVLVGQANHAMQDAGGARRMLEHWFRFEPDAPLAPLPPRPPLEECTAWERWTEGWAVEAGKAADLARRTGRRAAWARRHPRPALARAKELVQAARRLQEPLGPEPLSPLLVRRSTGLRFDEMVVDVEALRAGARSAGGTLNDGLMAAMALGLQRWHLDLGIRVPAIRTAIPIDRRAEGGGWEGNDVLALVVHLPLDDDALGLVKRCHDLSLVARDDTDALRLLEVVRAAGNRMPASLAAAITRPNLTGIDLSLSNSRGIAGRRWVGGVEQLRDIPFLVGTLSALCVALYTHGPQADLGLTTCPVAIPDPDHLVARLREGIEEVSALASS
jgi:hypothetical protein